MNSISSDCAVPIFVEKKRNNKEKVGDARREVKFVDPLTSDENNFLDFRITSCREEDFYEQRDISSNPYLSIPKSSTLISYGKSGIQIKRQIPLSPTKYFNQRF